MKEGFRYTAPIVVTLHAAYLKMLYSWMMWDAFRKSKMDENLEIGDLFTPGATKSEFYSDYALSMLREFHRYFLYSEKGPKDKELLNRLKTSDSQRKALSNFRHSAGFHIEGDMGMEIDVTEKLSSDENNHRAYYEDLLIIGKYLKEVMSTLEDGPNVESHFVFTITNLEKSVSSSDKYVVNTAFYPMD